MFFFIVCMRKEIVFHGTHSSNKQLGSHNFVSKGYGFACTSLICFWDECTKPLLIAHTANERYMSIVYIVLGQRKIIVFCLAKVSFDTHLLAHDWSHMYASKLWLVSIVYIDLFVRTFHPLVIASNRNLAVINTDTSVQSTKRCIEGFFCCCCYYSDSTIKSLVLLEGQISYYLQVNPQVQK